MLPTNLGFWHMKMRSKALSPEDTYALALGMERSASAPMHHPYRLFVATEEGTRSRAIDVGEHLVIGRHSHCDLVLPEDVGISLRHVLVRVSALDDGLPVFSLLDLDSSSGFELSTGARERSLVAVGPVFFRIGATSFIALPQGDPSKLPATLDPPLIRHSDAGGYRVNPYAKAPEEAEPRRTTAPRITIVRWSVRPSAIFVPRRQLPPSPSDPGASGPPTGWEIVLERAGGASVGIRVSAEDLGHGVMLGRHERCVDGGLKSFLREHVGVSRVHVLLIQERDAIRLYDVSSTNGTYEDQGQKIRQIALDDRGSTVALAGRGYPPVVLHWRAVYDEPGG
jgi:hypothetical protein